VESNHQPCIAYTLPLYDSRLVIQSNIRIIFGTTKYIIAFLLLCKCTQIFLITKQNIKKSLFIFSLPLSKEQNMANYKTILSVNADECNCNKLQFVDESVIPNDLLSHDVFGYRKIIVTTPDNTYTYGSLSSENPDAEITVLTENGVNKFNYTLQENDTDGVYNVTLYNFPVWNDATLYNTLVKHIVYYNEKLYKLKTTHTNINPENDTDNIYWDLYEISADTLKTRYATEQNCVITCISIDACYEKAVKDAFCEVAKNPCVSMCDNKAFQKGMKLQIVMTALCISQESKRWDEVAKQVQLLKSICCCGGGC